MSLPGVPPFFIAYILTSHSRVNIYHCCFFFHFHYFADTNAVLVLQQSALCLTGVEGALDVHKMCLMYMLYLCGTSQACMCVSLCRH